MGRKSVKENKNYYQICRENEGLTRAAASEKIGFVSAEKIEKIESDPKQAAPDIIYAMSKAYKASNLCNYYCSNECRIGQEYIPEIQIKNLSRITLEMLASLNALDAEKNRLIEITSDENISKEEAVEFHKIQDRLKEMAMAIDSLQLWMEQAVADGKIK